MQQLPIEIKQLYLMAANLYVLERVDFLDLYQRSVDFRFCLSSCARNVKESHFVLISKRDTFSTHLYE